MIWGWIINDDDVVADVYSTKLVGNYPNPFNPATTLRFVVGDRGQGLGVSGAVQVNIDVFNIKGQKVKTLVSDVFGAGEHSVVWNGLSDDGKAVSSGMYFYRMTSDSFSQTRKMVMVK